MKINKVILTYQCEHSWTRIYSKGISQREAKQSQDFAKQEKCPKCENKEVE